MLVNFRLRLLGFEIGAEDGELVEADRTPEKVFERAMERGDDGASMLGVAGEFVSWT